MIATLDNASLDSAIRARLLAHGGGPWRGDAMGGHVLSAGLPAGALRPAAVLIPIVLHDSGPTVLLTLRSPHLSQHAGQVSFPGGMTMVDELPLATALREAQEEIGLAPEAVQILGRLDDYVTTTSFRVAPFVASLRPPLELVPDPTEVAAIFEVPLSFLLDPAHRERHQRIAPDGKPREFYAFNHSGHFIWGATAAMLVNLAEALEPAPGSPALWEPAL